LQPDAAQPSPFRLFNFRTARADLSCTLRIAAYATGDDILLITYLLQLGSKSTHQIRRNLEFADVFHTARPKSVTKRTEPILVIQFTASVIITS